MKAIHFVTLSALLFLCWSCASLPIEEQVKKIELRYSEKKERSDLEELLRITRDSKLEPKMRHLAVEGLGRLQGRAVDEALVALSQDGLLRDSCLSALVKKQARDVSAPLIALHKDTTDSTFLARLGELRDENSLPFLRGYFLHEKLGLAAWEAAITIGGEGAFAIFAELLLDTGKAEDSAARIRIRKEAFQAAVRIKPRLPENVVTDLLESPQLLTELQQELEAYLRLLDLEAVQKMLRTLAQLQRTPLVYVELYQRVSSRTMKQSFLDLGLQPPVAPQAIMSPAPIGRAGSVERVNQRISLAARQSGFLWSEKKSRQLTNRIAVAIDTMHSLENAKFQYLYQIMARLHPQKSFVQLKEEIKNPINREYLLRTIVRDARATGAIAFQERYLMRVLQIDQLQARVLLRTY